jgi:autotransporter-associated beta strand protein
MLKMNGLSWEGSLAVDRQNLYSRAGGTNASRIIHQLKRRGSRRVRLGLAAVAGLGLLAGGTRAWAGSLYWSASGNDAGGTGQWDNSTTQDWWDGSAAQYWNSTTGQDVAVFDGTAGTATINSGETINVNSMVFNTSGYTVAGDSTTTLQLNNNGIITTTSGTTTITAPILGGNMDVEGSGTLVINNSLNYIQGTVKVGAGSTLNVFSPANNFQLGTAQVLNGGTLLYSAVAGNSVGSTSAGVNVTAPSTIEYNNLTSGGSSGTIGAATYYNGLLTLAANLTIDPQSYYPSFYYGMPTTYFYGGIALNNNVTLNINGSNGGGANTVSLNGGGITGSYTLTKAGNGNLNIGAGGNYSGLNISGGTVKTSDVGGFPTSTLILGGGTLNGTVPAGSTVNVGSTTITGASNLNIDQPGNGGGSAYNLGTLSLGANFNVSQPAAYNYYWGQSSLNFTATTLTADSTINVQGGSNGGGTFTVNLGPITGAHTLTIAGTSPVSINTGTTGNYSGLVLLSGPTQIADPGGFPTGTLNLAGGALTLVAAPGVTVTDTTVSTLVSTSSTINIQQPSSVGYGSSGAATYNLGSLTLGANLTIGQTGGPNYYYGQPSINFTAVSLTTDATLSVSSQTSGGDPTDSIGPISGNHTLTIAGTNAFVNILSGAGTGYSGLVVTTAGGVQINDAGGFPTGTMNLAGGALFLAAAPGVTVTDTTVTTLVGTSSTINIRQPASAGYGSGGAATYNLGPVTLGANLTIAQPSSGFPGYYYGQPQINFSTITLLADATLSISSQTAGGAPTDSIGPISGNHNLTITGNNPLVNILAGTGGNYSGLVINNSGGVQVNDAGGLPTGTLNLAGGSLTLAAAPGVTVTDTTMATLVPTNSTINIKQSVSPGSNGAATYQFGSLTLGANLSIVEPTPGSFYYGQPSVSFGATTLTANAVFNTSGGTTGGPFNVSLAGVSGSGFGLTKTGLSNLTLNGSSTYTGGTNVAAGTLVLASTGAFPAATPLIIGSGATVQIASHGTGATIVPIVSSLNSSGTIDLVNNAMVLQNSSGSLSTIKAEVATAFNGGAWNGSGNVITSSTAAADTTHLTAVGIATGLTSFEGMSVNPSDVLLKYTYYGDATLDGQVNSADYTKIDTGYLGQLTGWQNGDFNYDGVVNGSDYTLIDNAFNTQGAQLAAEVALPSSQIAVAGTSAVPEPASLGLLGIGALGLLGRRRRE